MKIKTDVSGFKPIDINITIENEEELKALWGRMSLCNDKVNESAKHSGMSSDYSCMDLFNELNSLSKKFQLL